MYNFEANFSPSVTFYECIFQHFSFLDKLFRKPPPNFASTFKQIEANYLTFIPPEIIRKP